MSDGDEFKGGADASAAAGSPEDLSYVEPEYDIGDVRRALKQLLKDLQEQQQQQRKVAGASAAAAGTEAEAEADTALRASYCAVLSTLSKVAANLLKEPPNPAHLSLNLRSAAVLTKFAAHGGARALLRFLGFEERLSAESHAMVVPLETLPRLRTRIERALVLLGKVREENAPPPAPQPAGDGMEDVGASAASASGALSPTDDDAPQVAAPASVFLANEADEAEGEFGATSPSPPPEGSMTVDLNPDYNIADVRVALRELYAEVEASIPPPSAEPSSSSNASAPARVPPFQVRMHRFTVREAYCAVLDTLAKVTQNVLRTPVNPAHLRINLANAAVQKKFAQFKGAREYLRFVGFKEASSDVTSPAVAVDAAAPATPSDAPQQQLLVLSEADLSRDSIKISRALAILLQQRSTSALSPEEIHQRSLGPIDRSLRVWDLNVLAAQPARALNPSLGAPDESVDNERADLALVMAASAVERKRVHELSRTDVIVTKQKQAEIREASKRKYHATLIKLTFTDKSSVQAPQGQGRFGGGDHQGRGMSGGYKLGSGSFKAKYGVPASAAAAPTAAPPVPMDMDGDDEKQSSSGPSMPVALPVSPNTSLAAPVATAAAASSSSSASATPAAAAAPPAELMLTAYFRPWETLGDLFAWVYSLLVHGVKSDAFYLHLPPNTKFQSAPSKDDKSGTKHTALMASSLQSLGLVPAAGLIFHYSVGSSAADVPGAATSSLREEIRVCKEPFDSTQVSSLMPQAENKEALEKEKARLIAEAKLIGKGGAAAASMASSSLGGAGEDEDDMDMEAYMARKKKAASSSSSSSAASSLANRLGGRSTGSASGGSSSSSGSSSGGAAGGARPTGANRPIPGQSQITAHVHMRKQKPGDCMQ